jgi:hypothetical protein
MINKKTIPNKYIKSSSILNIQQISHSMEANQKEVRIHLRIEEL